MALMHKHLQHQDIVMNLLYLIVIAPAHLMMVIIGVGIMQLLVDRGHMGCFSDHNEIRNRGFSSVIISIFELNRWQSDG
jgi:hypothetical protein